VGVGERAMKQLSMVQLALPLERLGHCHRVVRGKSAQRRHQHPDLPNGTCFLAECFFRRFVCWGCVVTEWRTECLGGC
jgi:hypothetical protein